MKKKLSSFLWVEKYRPENIKGMVLPLSTKKMFLKLVKDGEVPNLILHSVSPGSGKTTLAKAICNELQADTLYINSSKDRGIDVLRSRIEQFAVTKSFTGNPKIVILDEVDGSSRDFQDSLRAFSEMYHKSCRFILTCNAINKIIPALQSRCQVIDFNMNEKQKRDELYPKIVKRLCKILENEQIEYDQVIVQKLAEKYFPDIRKMIQICQQFSKSHDCINKDIFTLHSINDEFVDLILNKKFTDMRKYVIERNWDYGELYTSLYNSLIPKLPKQKIGQAIIILAEYMYRHSTVIDPGLNFDACILEIIGVL